MQPPSLFSTLNYRHLIWWILFIFYVLASFYVSYFWMPNLPNDYEVKSAYVVASEVGNVERAEAAQKKLVNLPDWSSADSLDTTNLWYLIPVQHTPGTSTKQAIYIPKVSQNIEVFLNGQWLGNGGNMVEPITRNRNNSLIFGFDSSLLNSKNTVAIHLVGHHRSRTYLGEVYIGPYQQLKSHAELNNYLRIELSTTITICMLLTSILVSVLWIMRQSDTYYLYYGVFSVLWAIHDSNHFVRNIPIPLNLWETLMPLSFGFAMLGVALFLHRIVGMYSKKIEKFLVASVFLLAVPFSYQDLDWILFYAYQIWSPLIAFIGIYLLYFLYDTYRKTQEDRLILLFISGFSVMIFGINDLLLAVERIPKQSPYMMHFAVLFTVVTIIVTLVNRFVQSINVVEHYNQELQHEIRRKTDEMGRSYRQVQQLMRQYTVAEERQRIMRDIHDSIGGQLVATLVSMDAGPVSQEHLKSNLRAALQDLRMVIDSLDYEAEDLSTLLGMLRMRLSNQLSNASLKLHWQVDDLPRIENFGPANVLNTMRIIQEAITNAIKHSGAKNLTISTSEFTGDDQIKYARIQVADDGSGIAADSTQEGRGLLNMLKRADAIGAKLSLLNEKGTIVRLDLPIDKQPDTP